MPSGGVHSITPLELWWQDEARVGQKNKIARRWARRGPGPGPRMISGRARSTSSERSARKGKGAAMVLPRCDTPAMSIRPAWLSITHF